MGLRIEFVGDEIELVTGETFVIGREGDLVVDENPFLHRQFLTLSDASGVWILANVGDQLAATVSDTEGRLEAFLGPGAVLPVVFEETTVRFTAGPTAYEFIVHNDAPVFAISPVLPSVSDGGAAKSGTNTTIGRVVLTNDQRLLILALAESGLRSAGGRSAVLPTSSQAAQAARMDHHEVQPQARQRLRQALEARRPRAARRRRVARVQPSSAPRRVRARRPPRHT